MDPDEVSRVVCLLPHELCRDFSVQFVSTIEDAHQEPSLQVSVDRLRNAIYWLSVNSWPWMKATRHMGILRKEDLGEYLERVLSAYSASVGPSGTGVPQELICTATKLNPETVPQPSHGPADAAMGAESDDEGECGEGATTKTLPKYVESSSAVVDSGLEDLTPLQIWNAAMQKYKVWWCSM